MSPLLAGDARLLLQPQEIALDHPESNCRFNSALVATPAAIEEFGLSVISRCYALLRAKAEQFDGLDRLQVFRDLDRPERRLWFIEDGGDELHVTALLPDDY
jgi:hypothetical protein